MIYSGSEISVGDINHDGNSEIAFVSDLTRQVYVIDNQGNLLEGWPKTVGTYPRSVVLANIDLDNELELLITGFRSTKVHAFNHDGSDVLGWPIYYSSKEVYPSTKIGAVGDINDDGFPEILVLAADGFFVFTRNGVPILGFDPVTDWHTPACYQSTL